VYFGLGPDTKPEDETTYWQYDALYDLVVGLQLKPWMALTTRLGYMTFGGGAGRDDSVPTIGERYDETTAPGITTQPDYFRISPQILIDRRDISGNPHRGYMVGIEFGYYDDRGGGDAFEFSDFAADVRGYVPLWSQQRVLALRALYYGSYTPGSNRMPFYMMETLGGSHTLRGYEGLRFRGEDVLDLQVEYRWEASPAVEFALFTDAGTVSEEDQSVELDTMKWDIGWGVRFKAYRFMVFRLDHARSEEMQRFLARLSASY
jgi:outer membrane protein assembly factor BamA